MTGLHESLVVGLASLVKDLVAALEDKNLARLIINEESLEVEPRDKISTRELGGIQYFNPGPVYGNKKEKVHSS
ncbi:unnamed protein product [Fusarium graminearum]|nr:unnamed protein product [Fusarium graminearum]